MSNLKSTSKLLSLIQTEKCGDGYEVVDVTTSPSMIVHWAMQYGDKVEILDEEVREKSGKN